MRKLLAKDPKDQKKITDDRLGGTKSDVVPYLAAEAPSALLDPICAVPRVVEEASLARDAALLIGRAIPRLREIQAIRAHYPQRLQQTA
jgi:tagatose 1,6-diphosphate aldolase